MTVATRLKKHALGRSLMRPDELKATLKSVERVADRFKGETLNLVELGVRRADTSARIVRLLERRARAYFFLGVDCDLAVADHWQPKITMDEREKHCLKYGRARLFIGTTISAAESVTDIHWCLVDADHCEACASHDIEIYGAKLVKGGLLLIHDTAPHKGKYAHLTQHHHTRPYGVTEAVAQSKVLPARFKLIQEIKDGNGMKIFEAVA